MSKTKKEQVTITLMAKCFLFIFILSGCGDKVAKENVVLIANTKPNVLFISIDDLRPQGRLYGNVIW